MVGHGFGEAIHEAAMAMRFRATLHDFIDLLHVFSTMAEALKTVARLDGTPFPSTSQLAFRWLRGRVPQIRLPWQDGEVSEATLEKAYCAEVVAATYTAMGLLDGRRPTNYYDPGRFWSGDDLELAQGARLGEEIEVLT